MKSGYWIDICIPTFMHEISEKQLEMSTDTWKVEKNVEYTYTMKYCTALKKEVLPFVAIWTNLQDIMLSEIDLIFKAERSR